MSMKQETKVTIVEQSIGLKFGKMKVIEFVEFRLTPKRGKVPMVRCQCDCEREKIVSLWDLRSGKTKSCAFDHPHYDDRSLPAFNDLYRNSYKGRALKNGLEFNLTESIFRELTQRNCHYCGNPPNNNSGRGMNRKTGNRISTYVYNGLDRMDSSKGYTEDNVVPCCGICNHAKHTMHYDLFIAWLDRIVAFRKGE